MHEFTDGCSVQYKSQLCMIDVDTCISKLGYKVLMRNFYETSHGKGPHAAVGGIFLKPRGLRSPTREVLKDTEN
jgi:hypothetical protein